MIAALYLAVAAAAAPSFARASEDIWGIAPCELCLWQRWPYWLAAALALGAALLPGRARRALFGLAVLAVLVSGAIGAFHVGVEYRWWPSPLAGCQAPQSLGAGASLDDLMRSLAASPSKPCDAPAYLVPGLPVSMAAMNVVFALGLAGSALILRRRTERSVR
jgi:disulfide bond formation protein DsbB